MVLLFYVHKFSRSIVADTVVERVSLDLKDQIETALADNEDHASAQPPAVHGGHEMWIGIGISGYIQTIDFDALIDLARKAGGYFQLAVRPGDFVLKHGPHVHIRTQAKADREAIDRIRAQFHVGPARSPAQDLEFSVRQLVESGMRALSPGAMDPFTAATVIDKLTQALELLTGDKGLPSPDMVDDDGVVRVRANATSFGDLVELAFDQMRLGAAGDAFILAHIASALGKILAANQRPDAEKPLRQHLDKLESTVKASLDTQGDQQACLTRIEIARGTRPCPGSITVMRNPSNVIA